MKRAVGLGDELKKSLTADDIVAAIAKQKKIALDKRLINLEQSITGLGSYTVPLGITLGNGQAATLQVTIAK